MKHSFLWIALAFGVTCGIAHADATSTNIDQALKIAQAKQEPVFVDFSAIWCHSCHAMDDKVLNGAEWDARQNRFVLVRSDADSANGSAWMKKLSVPALPTYVVLNPDGSERGRLTGEFTRAKFYPALDRLLSGADAMPKLETDAMRGSADAVAKVLRAYDDRDQQQDGLRWYAGLPATARKAVEANPEAATRLAVIEAHAEMKETIDAGRRDELEAMLRKETSAAKRKEIRDMIATLPPPLSASRRAALTQNCRTHARQALNGPLELDQHFDIAGTLLECAEALPKPQQKALAAAQLPALKALYDTKVPMAGSGALREATYTLANYYRVLGDSAGEKAAYQRAIAIGRKALDDGHGGFDVKRDQAMAEVFGEFLDRHGTPDEKSEDLALQKAMVGAYPGNAFYQTEYGGSLLKQGHAAAALPYLQRGADNASAQDKLAYTRSLAKALVALNRRPEAEKLFNAALRTAEKQFPKETKMYMTYWKQSGGVF